MLECKSLFGKIRINDTDFILKNYQGDKEIWQVKFNSNSMPEPLKISILGIEANKPGLPALLEGRYFRGGEARESVMDLNVALRTDLKVGDEIEIRSTQGTDDKFWVIRNSRD